MKIFLIFLSGFAFIFYGALCLTTNHMKTEFRRWGMENFRTLTGVLEVLGGAGLLVGLKYPGILILASGGLAVLMLMGMIIRLRSKDRLLEILPAMSLMLINTYILLKTF